MCTPANFRPAGQEIKLKYAAEFNPVGVPASLKANGDVVFAGFGMSLTEPAYDDYADIDVKDKIVILLRRAPKWDEKDQTLAKGIQKELGSPDFGLEMQVNKQLRGAETRELRRWTHKTIAKVTDDVANFHFNTMLAALMEFTNHMTRLRESGAEVDAAAWREAQESMALILAPSVGEPVMSSPETNENPGVNGAPLCARVIPEICQPSVMWRAAPKLYLLPNCGRVQL